MLPFTILGVAVTWWQLVSFVPSAINATANAEKLYREYKADDLRGLPRAPRLRAWSPDELARWQRRVDPVP